VSQLQQQYSLTEFGHCHGISAFTQNSVKFRENTEIPQQWTNSTARGKLWALVICHPVARIDIDYMRTKFDDFGFSRSSDMIGAPK